MALPQAMLIAGIPSAGKHYFGDWLAANHGFLHITDVSGARLKEYGLHQAWEASIGEHDARPFIVELQRLDRPAVLNWGFPLDSLSFISMLKHAGMTLWWFDADIKRARHEHVREGRDARAFDTRVAEITAHRVQIDTVFQPNVLQVLGARGARMSPEAILQAISRSL